MKPLHVAFIWHMHQPYYKDLNRQEYLMPWVRLHATKDYLDMPLLAAQYTNLRVTFNMVPSLLEQIEDYAAGNAIDPWLRQPGVIRLGYLPEREFWRAASATDACVNLRWPSAGETSAIAIGFMGIGKPVILSSGEETSTVRPGLPPCTAMSMLMARELMDR